MENQRRKRKAFTVKEKLEAIEHGTLLEIKCFGFSQFFFFELSFYSIQAEKIKKKLNDFCRFINISFTGLK